jgi:hypothetical protein
MNRILIGSALALGLFGATSAYAATSTTPVDYAARCTSLAGQWKTAETTNATHASLGKAKADAAKAEKLCKSKKSSDQKKGTDDYDAALKLLGVTPT